MGVRPVVLVEGFGVSARLFSRYLLTIARYKYRETVEQKLPQLRRVSRLRVRPVVLGSWFGVWCLGFGVWCLVFEVWGLEFGDWGLGFVGVWGPRFWVWGLGFGVWGFGFGI